MTLLIDSILLTELMLLSAVLGGILSQYLEVGK
jgi:hypothetical protein